MNTLIVRRSAPMHYVSNAETESALLRSLPEPVASVLADLHSEIVTARRTHRALSVGLLKVEKLDDTLTAERERRSLRRVLQIIGKSLRHNDTCGFVSRFEILTILPGADKDGCAIAMARLSSLSFAKITGSLRLGSHIAIAQLGAAEVDAAMFLDRVRSEISSTA